MSELELYSQKVFEEIKNIDDDGNEFWYARDLQLVLEYTEWRNFYKVIEKAKVACEGSDINSLYHFVDINKTIQMPKGAIKKIDDIELSRYACYLIVQNADPRKKVVALGQTYFTIQTRKQETLEKFLDLSEDKKRLAIRNDLKEHNKHLVKAADEAGIKTPQEYATFQNHGYKGLYGGMTAKDIHQNKGLKKSQQILDHMGSTELAANLFRATQTEDKIRRDNIQGKSQANQTHYKVGKKVRQTIEELGGTKPEDLPTPQKSIKQIERETNKIN